LAARSAPAVLADGLSTELATWLAERGDSVGGVVTLGGTGAVSYDLEFDVRNALRAPQ